MRVLACTSAASHVPPLRRAVLAVPRRPQSRNRRIPFLDSQAALFSPRACPRPPRRASQLLLARILTKPTEPLRALESRREVNVVFTAIQLPGELDGMGLARHVHEQWPNIELAVASREGGRALL
jgi:hypothetical protein